MKRIMKQVLLFAALIIFVSFFSFLLIELSPIDPINAFARSNAIGMTPEIRAKLIEKWGLDQPFLTRYILWFKNFIRGDLGVSTIYDRPVIEIIKRGFSSSIRLMALAWVLQGIVGITLGIVSGSNVGSIKDKIIKVYALVFAATPTFWVGMVLIMIFSIKLGWLPSSMGTPIGVESQFISTADRLKHLLLPCLTLVFVGVSNLILHTRTKVEDILNSDYVLYGKAKGIPMNKITYKYAFKNIILPGITIQFTYFSELFSGTVLVENLFNYQGLGNLTVQSGLRGDIPLLLGLVLFSTVFVYLGNRVCDGLYLIIDPRGRGRK